MADPVVTRKLIKTILMMCCVLVGGFAYFVPDSDYTKACWKLYQYYTFPGLTESKIHNPGKCRANCFAMHQLKGECNVFVNQDPKCLHSVSNVDLFSDYLNSTHKNFGPKVESYAYFLREECSGDSCWIPTTHLRPSKNYNSVEKAVGVAHCRFLCLETAYCFHAEFTAPDNCRYDDNVDLQYVNVNDFYEPNNIRLLEKCKEASCWKRVLNQEVTHSKITKVQGWDDMNCREQCLEHEGCHLYTWKKGANICKIMKGPLEGEITTRQMDVVTYYYLEKCQKE